ncbi:hypothetical protein THOM_3197 [Trachipleistophora hominis]|uniref:Uncharacterized protein n=1 Tax=Trachipleistophora hominis TaxID=72359 RepID=L7JRH2_TRAHO|nr:hypothetical protein THOM_3197 [Trachipleistophora hominis]
MVSVLGDTNDIKYRKTVLPIQDGEEAYYAGTCRFKRSKSDTLACHQAVNSVEKTLLPAKISALRTSGLPTRPVVCKKVGNRL